MYHSGHWGGHGRSIPEADADGDGAVVQPFTTNGNAPYVQPTAIASNKYHALHLEVWWASTCGMVIHMCHSLIWRWAVGQGMVEAERIDGHQNDKHLNA